MRLSLQREPSENDATIGSLYVNGAWQCFTLEDVVRERSGIPVAQWKVQNQTAIPAGTYRITVDFSNRFQRNMLHILDVPGFDGIRIHSGNTTADTDGCILVGKTKNGAFIGESKDALKELQPLIEAALAGSEDVTIEIASAPEVVT